MLGEGREGREVSGRGAYSARASSMALVKVSSCSVILSAPSEASLALRLRWVTSFQNALEALTQSRWLFCATDMRWSNSMRFTAEIEPCPQLRSAAQSAFAALQPQAAPQFEGSSSSWPPW
jgi:hypothetical protein